MEGTGLRMGSQPGGPATGTRSLDGLCRGWGHTGSQQRAGFHVRLITLVATGRDRKRPIRRLCQQHREDDSTGLCERRGENVFLSRQWLTRVEEAEMTHRFLLTFNSGSRGAVNSKWGGVQIGTHQELDWASLSS